MRVIQRLMGVENPMTELKVYEHTLHFRGGIATIEYLTEREINRLRAFGFRVERDSKKTTTVAQTTGSAASTPVIEAPMDPEVRDVPATEDAPAVVTAVTPPAASPPPKAPPKPKASAKAKKED